jgi:hypothetical protein
VQFSFFSFPFILSLIFSVILDFICLLYSWLPLLIQVAWQPCKAVLQGCTDYNMSLAARLMMIVFVFVLNIGSHTMCFSSLTS